MGQAKLGADVTNSVPQGKSSQVFRIPGTFCVPVKHFEDAVLHLLI